MTAREHALVQSISNKLLTIRDVADFADVSIMTVRRWIEQSGSKSTVSVDLVRISPADLDAFLRRKAPTQRFQLVRERWQIVID